MFGLNSKERDTINAAAKPLSAPQPEVVVVDAPKAIAKPTTAQPQSRMGELVEYAKVAQQVGLNVPALEIEAFVALLEKLNLPVYNLQEVVAYMDDKAKREGNGWGWDWRPLRSKDRFEGQFGTAARSGGMFDDRQRVASDYYAPRDSGMGMSWDRPLYDQVVPLHALQRIAAIEAEYTKPVHFVVTAYTPQPHLRADPFLMAVIPNPQMGSGVGRFIIDFWDEPGFGIASMLK